MAKCPSVYLLLGEQEMVRCVSLRIPRFNLVSFALLSAADIFVLVVFTINLCVFTLFLWVYIQGFSFSSFIYSVLVKYVGDYEQYSNVHQPEDKKLLELTMLLLHFDLIVNVSTVKYLYFFKLDG